MRHIQVTHHIGWTRRSVFISDDEFFGLLGLDRFARIVKVSATSQSRARPCTSLTSTGDLLELIFTPIQPDIGIEVKRARFAAIPVPPFLIPALATSDGNIVDIFIGSQMRSTHSQPEREMHLRKLAPQSFISCEDPSSENTQRSIQQPVSNVPTKQFSTSTIESHDLSLATLMLLAQEWSVLSVTQVHAVALSCPREIKIRS
jgi:hypothetical protein